MNQPLFTVFKSLNVFMTESNNDSLINIATKDVATDTIKNSLLQAYDLGNTIFLRKVM